MPDSRIRRPRLLELLFGLAALGGAGLVTFGAQPPPHPARPTRPPPGLIAFRPNPRPLPGALGPVAVSGTINGAAQSVTCPVGDQGTVTCQITGTWVATLIFEATVDNLTWATVRANAIASDTLVTAPAANGLYVLAGNFTAVRVRDSAYTSGSAVITMRATPSSSANVPVSSVGGTGGGGGGGGAATLADGADVTEGALADAAVGDAAGTVNSHLRQIAKTLATAVPVTGTFFQATQPVSGTVTANQGGAPWAVGGGLTNNNAAPGVANFGSLMALANAAAPTWTEGNQVLLSADLSGRLRTSNTPSGTQTVSGTVAATQSGTWTVQPGNTANTTAWKVDGSAVTQPVSGTVTITPSGTQTVQGGAAAGAAVAGNPVLSGGRDASGNAQFIGGNNSGVFAQGPIANQSAVGGNPVWIAGSTTAAGGNTQGLVVESAAQPNLRVGIFNGANQAGAISGSDSVSNSNIGLVTTSQSYSYGGSSWERFRNNADATLLASAARTTTQTPANFTTYNAHSIIVTVDVTATTSTVSLTPTINYVDPASGKSIPLLTGTTIAATGTFTYWINPNVASTATTPYTKVAQADLGRVMNFAMAVGNANSQTYSVGYTLQN